MSARASPGQGLRPDQFDAARFPRKLNLGCGFDHRAGYVNIDMNAWHEPDLLADVRKLGFLPAGHYEEIVAQDVLEHLPRTQTVEVLRHWNWLLRRGGRLLLRVPSVLGVAELLAKPENQRPEMQEELIQCLFGTQGYSGDFHFTSFTRPLMEDQLERAGFRVASCSMLHGWLFDVVAEKVEERSGEVRDFAALLAIENDAEFVRACYRELLGREPDDGGFRFYCTGLAGQGMTRQVVIDTMVGSPEYRARSHAG